MQRFISFVVLVALMMASIIFTLIPAVAEDRRSVSVMLPGCRFAAYKPAPVRDDEWSMAIDCNNSMKLIIKNGRIQPKFMASCLPDHVQLHTAIAAVVAILEGQTDRRNERFDIAATSALHQTWPCTDSAVKTY